jgi:hypothetical protein
MGVNGQHLAPAALCSVKRTPGTHCTGGWVDPTAGLDTGWRKMSFLVSRGSNLNRPVVQPVARHYTDWATRLTIQTITAVNSAPLRKNDKLSSFVEHSWEVTISSTVQEIPSFYETKVSLLCLRAPAICPYPESNKSSPRCHSQFSQDTFLTYFPKMKVGLSNHQPVCVCVSPTNNFWTDRWIFMKFGRQVMPLKMTMTPQLQPFQNDGRLNFWGGCKETP